jgi:hypothetical protein
VSRRDLRLASGSVLRAPVRALRVRLTGMRSGADPAATDIPETAKAT